MNQKKHIFMKTITLLNLHVVYSVCFKEHLKQTFSVATYVSLYFILAQNVTCCVLNIGTQ